MSKYTTMVRFICENAADVEEGGYSNVDDILTEAIPKVFDFTFPIWDEDYRELLCRKILKHYYMREICCETVGLWKLFLDRKLNEIMPYYNELYKSTVLEFNPLYDVDLTTTTKGERVNDGLDKVTEAYSDTVEDNGEHTKNRDLTDNKTVDLTETVNTENVLERNTQVRTVTDGTVTGTGTTVIDGSKWDKFSDTPQGALTGVENGEYLTTARENTDNTTTTVNSSDDTDTTVTQNNTGTDTTTAEGTTKNTGTDNTKIIDEISGTNKNTRTVGHEGNSENEKKNTTTEDFLQTIVGVNGGKSYSRRVLEYRETFINIDMMIIKELGNLFMQIW